MFSFDDRRPDIYMQQVAYGCESACPGVRPVVRFWPSNLHIPPLVRNWIDHVTEVTIMMTQFSHSSGPKLCA
ncbi:hypothetical protein BLOT_000140 [Blomia tropicalis]|nr:hypothetical protein BLOT_000140 [Blomia tropicalis]